MFVHTPVLWIQTNHILNAPTISVGLGPAGGGADHHVRRGGAAMDRWELWKRSPREGGGSEMMNGVGLGAPSRDKGLVFFFVYGLCMQILKRIHPQAVGGVE